MPTTPADSPRIALRQLDNLWFQLTGSICNLACSHCFISCSPTNHTFSFLSFESVMAALQESRNLGVKEYYFTGGEPFLHPRICDILQATLQIGPATVLTNGTLLDTDTVRRLAELADASIYSLELRVSIDSPDRQTNDNIRGVGAFDMAIAGVGKLLAAGFLPIITMTQTWPETDSPQIYRQMRQLLLDLGYTRPRLKILPVLHIGAETRRGRPYRNDERVTNEMMEGFDTSTLICNNSRIISDRGVHVCPILLDQPDSLLAPSLAEAIEIEYPLRHQACHTCWLYGSICSNASSAADTKEKIS